MELRIPKINFTIGWQDYNRSWGIMLSWGIKDQPLKEGESAYKHCMGISVILTKY